MDSEPYRSVLSPKIATDAYLLNDSIEGNKDMLQQYKTQEVCMCSCMGLFF